jgi:undecaprenyl-diphosphatase
MEYLAAVVMGLIEGLTEFLPISSTGHLILTDHLLDFKSMVGGDLADAFEIIIQLGAILAIIAAYPGRFVKLLRFRENEGFSGMRGLCLLAVTTIPASLVGFATHRFAKENLSSPMSVALAMTVGAVWIIILENSRLHPTKQGLDSLTWKEALWIGLFQCLSLWKGMSRSASTILGGMMCGVERKTATEYSFFAAVPIMIAATAFELVKYRDILTPANLGLIGVGFVVSFVSAWLAVKTFVHFLGRHTLEAFGWYRLIAAVLVVWLVS